MADSGLFQLTQSLSVNLPAGTIVSIPNTGVGQTPVENPTGVAATFDAATRKPTVTWATPSTGDVRVTAVSGGGVATSATVSAALKTYTFDVALPAGSGYFDLTVQSLTGAGLPAGLPVTTRVSPPIGLVFAAPGGTGRVISSTLTVSGGESVAPVSVGVKAQYVSGSGTVLSTTNLPNVTVTGSGLVSFTVPDSAAQQIVRLVATYGNATVTSASKTFAANITVTEAVAGVTGSFNRTTRIATVNWTAPSTGTVTLTRTDNAGGTVTTTQQASLKTFAFPTAVAVGATSVTVRVTGSDGSTGQATVDATPDTTATIPGTAVTAPSSAFTVSSGTWQTGSAGERYTSTSGAALTLDFTGPYFELTVVTDAHHGTLNVAIDGGTATAVNQSTATRNETAVVYANSSLTDAAHRVVLLCAGTGTVTVVRARVKNYSGGTTTTPPNPGTGTPAAGFITRDPNSARLLLNGQTYKFVGMNGVNFFGATNATRQITDYADYYANRMPGELTRVWFQPGMGTDFSRMDAVIAAAKANNAKVYIALFDALGTYGPNWSTMKANWSTYLPHVQRVCGRYRNETTVAFWEIANEPPIDDRAGFDLVGSAIKAADPNHLVCTGTVPPYSDAGVAGYQNAGASPYVDILSLHEYDSLVQGPSPHLNRILPVARALKKPIVIGEFGIDANATGTGPGGTASNGVTTFQGRANLIRIKTDAYNNIAEVVGCSYWSPGKNDIGTGADSYMAYSDTVGFAAMRQQSAKWTKHVVNP